jgi:uncharacterized protein
VIDLAPEHLATVNAVLAATVPGVSAYAFGSRVTGRAKKHSDLDVALLGPESLSWRQLAQAREAFETSNLPIRVDLVDWAACSPQFKALAEPLVHL